MTQMDVERTTAARYGAESRVFAQQVSRIEKGQFDKPPMLDLLRIGEALGLKPDDIAEMFGLWPRQGEVEPLDTRVQDLMNLSQQVPFDIREELLSQVEVVVALTRAKLRQRLQEREDAGELPGPHEKRRPTRTSNGPRTGPDAGRGSGSGGGSGKTSEPVEDDEEEEREDG
jgi:hypothetical protein